MEGLIIILLILLTLTTIVACSLCIYMYRWRTVLVGEENALLPEQTASVLRKNIDTSERYMKSLPAVFKEFTQVIQSSVDAKLSEQNELISVFRDAVEKREQMITRLQDGYEAHLFKKGAAEIIEVHDFVRELAQEETIDRKDLEVLEKLTESVLRAFNIEVQHPDIGQSVPDLGSLVSNSYKTQPTNDPTKDMTVAEVLSPAYVFRGPEYRDIYQPSKVKIFIYFEQEGE